MTIVSDPPDETPEQLLARLLRCPKLKAAVCKVARSQGVPPDEEEDVYQETMVRMSKATLPTKEAEARKYVHGIGKFAAIDHLRATAEDAPTESLEAMKTEPPPMRATLEERAQLKQVFSLGRALFGEQVWGWWERSKIHQESSEEIGRDAGYKASHVRHEVSVVSRWFDGTWGKRGGIGGMLVLLLALGLGAKWLWTPHGFDESQLSTYSEVRTDHRVVGMDAAALRERGRAACDAGAWGACENDLAAAAALDREGHTAELQQMQLDARTKQMRFDADGGGPGEQMNAKPGR